MEELTIANRDLKAAHATVERDYEVEVGKLDSKEYSLRERLNKLNKKKSDPNRANLDAKDDDLVEVNVGGKIITARRSTLTQFKGTRFEALFSGRWDKTLQRDNNGRIFLDVDSVCFQAIVDYLNELAISSEDNLPSPPSVKDVELKHILRHQLGLLGLDELSDDVMPGSSIIKYEGYVSLLHGWLKEDGSDGLFRLLYRSSRDGTSAASFHSKCDNKGCTVTLIETIDGYVFGGYSNTPWTSNHGYHTASKAFLFVLCGNGFSAPCRMRLKNTGGNAVYHSPDYGPVFGKPNDSIVIGTTISSFVAGRTYDSAFPVKSYTPKNMEVFEVSSLTYWEMMEEGKGKQAQRQMRQVEPVNRFSEDINRAMNVRQMLLSKANAEILNLKETYKDEHNFITSFASADTNDVVNLNVSGTMISTKRSTLQTFKDSVLAQQFDDSKWTEQGCNIPHARDWTPEDVLYWAQNIHGIQDDVGHL